MLTRSFAFHCKVCFNKVNEWSLDAVLPLDSCGVCYHLQIMAACIINILSGESKIIGAELSWCWSQECNSDKSDRVLTLPRCFFLMQIDASRLVLGIQTEIKVMILSNYILTHSVQTWHRSVPLFTLPLTWPQLQSAAQQLYYRGT